MNNNSNIKFERVQESQNLAVVIIGLLVFVICPFVGFILGFYLLSHRRDVIGSFFLIIGFAALYGYSILPIDSDDIINHYGIFSDISNINKISVFFTYIFISGHPDFGMELLYWIIGKFGDNHQIVGALGALLYYGFLLAIIYRWLNSFDNRNYKDSLLITTFALLALVPSNEFCGMRQGFANALFIYLILTFPYSKIPNSSKLFILLLPCIIHFSTIPYVFLYYIASKCRLKKTVIVTICLSVSGFFIMDLMGIISGFLSHLGFIGTGIALKIEDYMFSGDIEKELYSGSRLRYYLLLVFVFVFPFILREIKQKRYVNLEIKGNVFRFFILFYGYMIFSSQTYIMSRTLMMFKIIVCLCISMLAFCKNSSNHVNRLYRRVLLSIGFIGIICYFQALEYRVVNPVIFYSSLPNILSITTDPNGYPI